MAGLMCSRCPHPISAHYQTPEGWHCLALITTKRLHVLSQTRHCKCKRQFLRVSA